MSANPSQSSIKATIKRASKLARDRHFDTDEKYQEAVAATYLLARDDIEQIIRQHGDALGIVRLEQLNGLLEQIDFRLEQLQRERNALLQEGMQQAAEEGIEPIAAVLAGLNQQQLAAEAVRQITLFVEADGLQLSDRLWNIDAGAAADIAEVLNRAIIQGHSAAEATQDYLSRGEPVPGNLRGKERQAAADAVAAAAADKLNKGVDSARAQVQRVMRTELNRAHGEAYMAAAFQHPDVAATRFLLSPRHPRRDICDMHAAVNLYGLGPGVYPRARNPWPAHPNTISYVEVVFADEISAADRAGKTTRIDWLKAQDATTQAAVLGGVRKRAAFLSGHIGERSIGSKWRNVKERLRRQGIDTEQFEPRRTNEPA